MKTIWALQDAKNRFSEVVESALHQGPQWVTRRGQEAVVVVSVDKFQALTGNRGSLMDFLSKSPLRGVDLDLRRDAGTGREVMV